MFRFCEYVVPINTQIKTWEHDIDINDTDKNMGACNADKEVVIKECDRQLSGRKI